MVELYEKYRNAIENGCDRNCDKCGLFLLDRDECVIEANKKWQKWADRKHEEFAEILKGAR